MQPLKIMIVKNYVLTWKILSCIAERKKSKEQNKSVYNTFLKICIERKPGRKHIDYGNGGSL